MTIWAAEAGIAAEAVSDGREAARRVQAGTYDLIVLDLNLEMQSGFEVLAEIRAAEKRSGRAATPVIAASATVTPEILNKCEAAGFIRCLEKPIPKDLWHRLLTGPVRAPLPAPDQTAIDVTIEDLIPMYLENRRDDIARMTTASERGDWATIESLAHKIKGSGASYGFPQMSDIGRELEAAARGAKAAEVRDGIRRLKDYLAEVEAERAAAKGPR
jgi:CheY-like chemotaxis protein